MSFRARCPAWREAAALSSGGWVAFKVGRTLWSEVALPLAVASPLSPAPPPERDTPRPRNAAAEGLVEGFAAEGAAEAAVEEEASASSAAGVLLSLAVGVSLAADLVQARRLGDARFLFLWGWFHVPMGLSFWACCAAEAKALASKPSGLFARRSLWC